MERLWTPWRMKYLVDGKSEGCVFCSALQGENDRDNLLLLRGENACLMLNLYPYNSGHLMVIPRAHVPSLEQLEREDRAEAMELVTLALRVLRKALNPDGFNVGVNIGKAAGAGICEHVHIHVVPRWDGDTNFMPITAGTRVMPELLPETYDRLKAVLEDE